MRLIVTGKTQSGKTTALHRLLLAALGRQWLTGLICDGKGHLGVWRDAPGVTYLGPDEIEQWAEELGRVAEAVPLRFKALLQRDLYEAPPDEPCNFILIDEVQKGTRKKGGLGKSIKDSLSAIAEQSAALGDVLVLSAQRDVNAIPPDVRHNANARLRMLGLGYFFYQCDGQPKRSGRVAFIEPAQARAALDPQGAHRENKSEADTLPLSPPHIPALLGAQPVEPTRAPAVLYLGEPGSGKTYTLHHHPNGTTSRHLYADFAQAHRATLVDLIEEAGAVAPPKLTIPDLAEIAALAVQAEPTLLLIDNVHAASPKALSSIERLMTAAANVALAADRPMSPIERRKLQQLYPRCEVREIASLSREDTKTLLWQTLSRNEVKRPRTVEAKILNEARGNPGTVVKLARRIQQGDERELRKIYTPVKKVNIGWLVLLAVIALAFVSRRVVDSYVALMLVTMVYIGLRPFIYRLMRSDE